ncbi:Uncharacterised protein [Klebsiella pneumoniae]|nr:Uncharacterised protein [Klebsiella pneumoniae]
MIQVNDDRYRCFDSQFTKIENKIIAGEIMFIRMNFKNNRRTQLFCNLNNRSGEFGRSNIKSANTKFMLLSYR